jgi:Mrp family chromosome partitioning ATPase
VLFVVESGKTRTRSAIEAINRIEATGAHILGVTLTKSTDSGVGYGYKGYGYGYGYGKLDKRRTEILMIPQGSDS